ncbi:MAG: DedA family protein [Balneolaceae bacterium]
MEEYIQHTVDWILTLSPLSIYIIYFMVAYIENIIPPIPGDILVAFGGYLAAEQMVRFSIVLGLTTVSSVLGFMTMYAIGAHWGYKIEEQRKRFWLMRFIDVKYFDKGKKWMHRWGQRVVLANRFLAGTRSVIALTAGITKTKFYPTALSSAISSFLWNGILLWAGWLVHENWQIIGQYLSYYGRGILFVIITALILKFILKQRKKKISEEY